MGATEEFRKKQGGDGKAGPEPFEPDEAVERALRDSIRVAQNNLDRYLQRVKQFKK